MSSPPALLAELGDDLMPLSEIFNQHRLSISSSIHTDQSTPPKSQNGSANSSFVRRSLRKIMKRNTVSTSALSEQYEGLRNNSLKRRASNASSSFFASAQAHLRPRTKSLKKQRLVYLVVKTRLSCCTKRNRNVARFYQFPCHKSIRTICQRAHRFHGICVACFFISLCVFLITSFVQQLPL